MILSSFGKSEDTEVVRMEKFSKVIIMLIVFDMCFKLDMAEARGNSISKIKDVNQGQNFSGLPPILPGFRNWNFSGQLKPDHPDNIPGGDFNIPGIFGFPPFNPGGGGSSIFPFLPYFSYDPPGYCIRLIGCIPIPRFLLPPPQDQGSPGSSPPDQGPLSPTSQPLLTNKSLMQLQTPPRLLPKAQNPAVHHMSVIPAGEVPTVPKPPNESTSSQGSPAGEVPTVPKPPNQITSAQGSPAGEVPTVPKPPNQSTSAQGSHAGEVPTVPKPPNQSISAQAEALTPPSPNP